MALVVCKQNRVFSLSFFLIFLLFGLSLCIGLPVLKPVLAQSASPTPSSLPHWVEDLSVQLDGHLEERVWSEIGPITNWYQQRPNEGAPPSEKTEMWLLYDSEALYLAARLHERDPEAVTVRTLERDSYDLEAANQDAIGLVLDAFNDQRSGLAFIVTPAGVRTDLEISNDGRGTNPNWDTFWDAATHQDDNGWTVEMRIPFSSLRFSPTADGSAEMGLILWRHLARNAEYDVFPEIPNNWASSAFKPSQARSIHLQEVEATNPFYVKPYVLAGVEREEALSSDGTTYTSSRSWRRKGGLDVKYNVTSDLILDVTLNTDFAQVEADDQRINLSRFSLFFPEKRDFFQERANLFTYRLPGGPQRLFQSRRIGIHDGQPVPILGGARLTGRLAGWEVGMIEMQTGQTQVSGEEVPSENFGVLRVKRPAGTRGSYVGGMLTSRTDLQGSYNVVAGADADLHLGADYFVGLQMAQSREPGVSSLRSTLQSVVVQRRVRRGWSFGSSFRHTGSDFNPGVGFLRRAGVNRWGHRTQYTWFPGSENLVQNHDLAHRFEFIWGSDFGRLETSTSSLTWNVLLRSSARAQVRTKFFHESLRDGFSVGRGELDIEPGLYRYLEGQASYTTRSGVPFRLEVEARGGGYFDGRQYGATLSPSWTPSPHLSLQLDYVFNRIALPQGTFEGHVGRFRVRGALNPTLSASAYIQYNSSERILTPNVRIRYNPREGNNLYLVFNEGRRTSIRPEGRGATPLRVPRRTILLKYTYTFPF